MPIGMSAHAAFDIFFLVRHRERRASSQNSMSNRTKLRHMQSWPGSINFLRMNLIALILPSAFAIVFYYIYSLVRYYSYDLVKQVGEEKKLIQ